MDGWTTGLLSITFSPKNLHVRFLADEVMAQDFWVVFAFILLQLIAASSFLSNGGSMEPFSSHLLNSVPPLHTLTRDTSFFFWFVFFPF